MKIALRADNGQVLHADHGGDNVGIVRADRGDIGPHEQFMVHRLGDRLAFQSWGKPEEGIPGRFWAAEGGGGGALHCNRALSTDETAPIERRTAIGIWETFLPVGSLVDGAEISLVTWDGIHFVCADRDLGGLLVANRVEAHAWETFRVVVTEPDAVIVVPGPVTPAPAFRGRLRTENRRLYAADGQRFAPVFISGFTAPGKVAAGDVNAVDEFAHYAQEAGYNGVRLMPHGAPWMGYGPPEGRRGLPKTLEILRDRGMYGATAFLTNTRDWTQHDKLAYVRDYAAIGLEMENMLAALANEQYHETQDDDVNSLRWLQDVALRQVPRELMTSIGACPQDEPLNGTFPISAGNVIDVGLGRGRDFWNQVRHIREMLAVAELTGKYIMDIERTGWGLDSRREPRPVWHMAAGVLDRIFDVGCVGHGQNGLRAELPANPTEDACARACARGARIWPNEAEWLTFKNARWTDSPVRNAHFRDDDDPNGAVIRVYSGVTADGRGLTACVGQYKDPEIEWQNGWHQVGPPLLDEDGGPDGSKLVVLEITRHA